MPNIFTDARYRKHYLGKQRQESFERARRGLNPVTAAIGLLGDAIGNYVEFNKRERNTAAEKRHNRILMQRVKRAAKLLAKIEEEHGEVGWAHAVLSLLRHPEDFDRLTREQGVRVAEKLSHEAGGKRRRAAPKRAPARRKKARRAAPKKTHHAGGLSSALRSFASAIKG